MARRLRKFSVEDQEELQGDYAKYRELNPTASLDESLLEGEHNEIVRNLKLLHISIKSKIEQILQSPKWQESRPLTDEEFKRSTRTIHKLIRELLVHPDDRREMDEKEDGKEIIDPRKITDTLLTNLELEEYIPEKGMRKEAKLEKRAEAIPEIQGIIESLDPLKLPGEGPPQFLRIMRITGGKNRGYILGTQNIGRDRKILFKTDLHGLIRRIEHMEIGYIEELEKLKEIESAINEINAELSKWTDLKGQNKKLENLREKLLGLVNTLKFISDEEKLKLSKKIEEAIPLKDSIGRDNPSAIMAKLQKSKKYIEIRRGHIDKICRHVRRDKSRAEGFAHNQEWPLLNFFYTVEELHEKFKILRPQELSAEQKNHIIGNLIDLAHDAQMIQFEPERTMADEFLKQIYKVVKGIQSGNKEEAAQKFVEAYIVTKILRAKKKVYDVYREISVRPDEADIDRLMNELESTHEELANRKVAPEINTEEYYRRFGTIYHLLNGLKKSLRELKAEGESGDRKKTFEEMKDRIKGVEFTENDT